MATDRPSVTLTKREIRGLYEYVMLTGDDPDWEDQEFVVEYKQAGEVTHDDECGSPLPAGYYLAELDALEEGWTPLLPSLPSWPAVKEKPASSDGE